ncbi:conserved Plasmodium protein, unknown function [Plasmodium ovale curtisi]|uniref:Uncharacterized protein n=1 Tax=Plasmodium ovale curtisi TaxID=864141 RepID=A0A1A8VMZ5_PLAOA|nr:conserved Plasmodium protein, unknown function [Plasmodium ovale curtisi]
MEDTAPSNLIIKKRYDHLKEFSNNIAALIYDLKDLIKVHEILVYKEKIKTSEKGKIKKQQDDLMSLKEELEIIKRENEKMDGQLKYYKRISDAVNNQMKYVSENIQKVKLSISLEKQKKVEMKKNINEMKNKYCKSLKQKQILNDNFLQLTKRKKGRKEAVKASKEVGKEINKVVGDGAVNVTSNWSGNGVVVEESKCEDKRGNASAYTTLHADLGNEVEKQAHREVNAKTNKNVSI